MNNKAYVIYQHRRRVTKTPERNSFYMPDKGRTELNMEHTDEHLDIISEKMPDEELIYNMAELFKAFSDSTRVRILCVLQISELTVSEITKLLSMNQSAISHQLRLLKQAHLVKFRRQGKNLVYAIADDHVKTIFSQTLEHIME
jgi:ArsR family transcriptional regulator